MVAEVDPGDPDEHGQDDPRPDRDDSHPATPDPPRDEAQGHVEDERVHGVTARKAEFGLDLGPGQLRPRAFEDELQRLVEQDAPGDGHRKEDRRAPSIPPDQGNHSDDQQRADDEGGSQLGQDPHE
ncbi:MAG: hypothetical protein M3P84_05340 [Chloroflexota bacterium]|nr:hypothetical protein [Chloroflexota bacterium]